MLFIAIIKTHLTVLFVAFPQLTSVRDSQADSIRLVLIYYGPAQRGLALAFHQESIGQRAFCIRGLEVSVTAVLC